MRFREPPSSSASWCCASFCLYTSSLIKSKHKIRNLFYKEVSMLLIYQHEITAWWWMVAGGDCGDYGWVLGACNVWWWKLNFNGFHRFSLWMLLHLTFKIWHNGQYFNWVKSLLFNFNWIFYCIIHDDRRTLHAVTRDGNWKMFNYIDRTISVFSTVFVFVIYLL